MQFKEGFVASEVAARSCLHEEEEIEGSDRQVLIRNWNGRKGSARRVAYRGNCPYICLHYNIIFGWQRHVKRGIGRV